MSGEYLWLPAKSFLFTGRPCSFNNSEAVDLAAEGRIAQPLCIYDLTGSSTSLKTDEQRSKMVC